MNTIVEIEKALDLLVAKMADKGVSRPDAHLTVKAGGERPYVYLASAVKSKTFNGSYSKICYGATVATAFKQAHEVIDALPNPEDAVTHEYLSRVASAVDYATEHSIDEEYVAPLRGVTCAMTENLLTKQEQ